MCSAEGEVFDGIPLYVTITHTGTRMEQERMEVLVEENRIQTAKMMKELARAIALTRRSWPTLGKNSLKLTAYLPQPRMNMYLEQAKAFNKDPTHPPTQPLPRADADRKQEIDKDPFGPTVRAVRNYIYIQTAAQSLKAIEQALLESKHIYIYACLLYFLRLICFLFYEHYINTPSTCSTNSADNPNLPTTCDQAFHDEVFDKIP